MAKRRFIDNSTPTAAPGLGGSPGMKAGYAGSPGSNCDPCCPPPEEEDECEVTECEICDCAPAVYRVSDLSGLGSGDCSCDGFAAASHDLPHLVDDPQITSNCFWRKILADDPDDPRECEEIHIDLRLETGTPLVRLLFRIHVGLATNIAIYEIPLSEWQCLGKNTMTLAALFVQDTCSNWPDTLTVEPAP